MSDTDLLPIGEFTIGPGVPEALAGDHPVEDALRSHTEGDSGSAVESEADMLAQAIAFGFGGDFRSRHHMPDGKILVLETVADRSHTKSKVVPHG